MMITLKKTHNPQCTTRLLILCFVNLISFTAHSHNGHPNKAPWHACEEKKLSEACSYQTKSTLYKGTCRTIKSELICVRNQPLEPIKQSSKDGTKTNINTEIFEVQTYENLLANVKN